MTMARSIHPRRTVAVGRASTHLMSTAGCGLRSHKETTTMATVIHTKMRNESIIKCGQKS